MTLFIIGFLFGFIGGYVYVRLRYNDAYEQATQECLKVIEESRDAVMVIDAMKKWAEENAEQESEE